MSGDGDSGSGGGYKVDTSVLRSSAKNLTNAAGHWTAAIGKASGATMADDTLGLIGQLLKFPATYNAAQAALVNKAKEGPTSLNNGAKYLNMAAAAYEGRDADTKGMYDGMDGDGSDSGGSSGSDN